jgi:hypothetical protein
MSNILVSGKNFVCKTLESQKRSEYTNGIRSKLVKVKLTLNLMLLK